jgi:acyl-CoA dehydrogenase
MIGFALSEDQVAAQKWAREFAEKEIRPVAPHYDETEEFPWPVISKAADIGLYGMDFYRMIGEDETGILQPLLVEELCWGCAGISLGIFGTGLPLVALMASGTSDQVARWTPELFGTPEDPKVGAFAVTEPGAGSDVSSLRTRAVRDGDDWVLNGQKVFITNGGIANVHVVVATVDPSLGHRGQASFVIPPGTPGLRQGKKERKLGIRASHTAEVLLEDCRVAADCLLGGDERLQAKLERARAAQAAAAQAAQAGTAAAGGPGAAQAPRSRGSSGALATFEATRPIVGAQAVGIARAAFEFARDYARERVQFGKPIAAQQAIAFKLADMATEIDAARLLVWRASWMARNGMGFAHAEGSMSKLKAGEVATRVTDEAIQILGGYGFIRDFPVEKWHRDAKIYSLFEGTSEIQRLVISRANGGMA